MVIFVRRRVFRQAAILYIFMRPSNITTRGRHCATFAHINLVTTTASPATVLTLLDHSVRRRKTLACHITCATKRWLQMVKARRRSQPRCAIGHQATEHGGRLTCVPDTGRLHRAAKKRLSMPAPVLLYITGTLRRHSYRPAGRLDIRFETISFYRGLTMSLYESGLFRPSWYQMYSLFLRQLEASMTTAM